ncbi:MAG: DNA alkylation repair protein [Actinobacteria bacterium]|nr:MAG: DNA alkylation repair protein [Actinomycetota bacterium]
MRYQEVLEELHRLAGPAGREGMARFGIRTERALGISMPSLRALAKRIGTDHRLAGQLWRSRIHEARLLASMVEDPATVTEQQMEDWAEGFDSWDMVDVTCGGLFDRTPFAYAKAAAWSSREEEFVKRAGFALMASLAVHDRRASDHAIARFLPLIERQAWDGRNFVKKAVNWALRQIGKRNLALNERAIGVALRIQAQGTGPARWIAADALRELRSDAVQERLRRRS